MTPTFEQGGETFDVTITANDGFDGTDSVAITIAVNAVNREPIITQRPESLVVDAAVESQTVIGVADADGDQITATVVSGSGSVNPTSVSGSGDVAYSVTLEQGDITEVTQIDFDDGRGGVASVEFTVTSVQGNVPPTFAGFVDSGDFAKGGGFTRRMVASDPDEDRLIFTIEFLGGGPSSDEQLSRSTAQQEAPRFLEFSRSGILVGRAGFEDAGRYRFRFTATERGTKQRFSVSAETEVVIANTNRAPQFLPIDNLQVSEGETGSLGIEAVDADTGDRLTIKRISGPGRIETTSPNRQTANLSSAAVTYAISPPFDAVSPAEGHQTHTVTVGVTDGKDGTATASFDVTIGHVNQPPICPEGVIAHTVTEGTPDSFLIPADDPDGNTLTYGLTGELAQFAGIDPSTGEIIVAPDFTRGRPDPYSGTVTVRDGAGGREQCPVSVTVLDVNREPTFKISGDLTIIQGETYQVAVVAGDPDPDDAVSIVATLPDGSREETTGEVGQRAALTLSGQLDVFGLFEISLEVSDGKITTPGTITVIVTERENLRPTIFAIPTQSIEEGRELTFEVNATDPDTPLEGATNRSLVGPGVTLEVENVPEGAEFDPETGLFIWTPDFDQARLRPYVVRFTAADEKGASDTVLVTLGCLMSTVHLS